MTNLMNQKVGGSKAASPAKCGAQSSKNKKVASPVCVFRCDNTMKRGVWVEVGMKKDGTPEGGDSHHLARKMLEVFWASLPMKS